MSDDKAKAAINLTLAINPKDELTDQELDNLTAQRPISTTLRSA